MTHAGEPPARFADVTTVFLDRDGTINVKAPSGRYITAPDQVELLPGAGAAIRAFNEKGFLVIVVTNQRCVARGLMSCQDFEKVTARLADLLVPLGAHIDATYCCPHADGVCNCRKPLPGLLLRAAWNCSEIDLARSVMIGDAETDVHAGLAAGTRTIRLSPPGTVTDAEATRAGLSEAADLVLASFGAG